MLDHRLVRERRSQRIFLVAITFTQKVKTLHRGRSVFILSNDFLETVARGGKLFLLKIEVRDVEFMLGEIVETFGEFLFGFGRLGRFRVIGEDVFEVALGDLGIFLIAVDAGKLVEMGLPQTQRYERHMLVRRMHRLEFLKSVDRFGVLLVAILSVGDFQFDLGHERAKRMIGSNLRVAVDRAHVTFVVEIAVAFFE